MSGSTQIVLPNPPDYDVIRNDQSWGKAVTKWMQQSRGLIFNTPIPNLPSASNQTIANIVDFKASTTSPDNTASIQTAINSLKPSGGIVYVPAGTFTCTGTLSIPIGGITLMGTGLGSVLLFANGSLDSIDVGSGIGQIEGVQIRDLYINHSGKTGGIAISMQDVAESRVVNVVLDHTWDGIYLKQINTVDLDFVTINCTTSGAGYALSWDGTGGVGSAGLNVRWCTFQASYSGANGIVWNGNCQTLRVVGTAILGMAYGLWIRNTDLSGSLYPEFGELWDVEIDGASITSLQIDAGATFNFTGCEISNTSGASGQGSADLDCVVINPDNTHSVTRQIKFVGCKIGNTQRRAAFINCLDVEIVSCWFSDASKAGVNSYPAVEIGANADRIRASATTMGHLFGETDRVSYGLIIDSGAAHILMSVMSFFGAQTGAVQNNTSGIVQIMLGSDQSQNPFTLHPLTVRQDVSGGQGGTVTIQNAISAAGTLARLEWLTGTGNSFALVDFTDADKLNISTASGVPNGIRLSPSAGFVTIRQDVSGAQGATVLIENNQTGAGTLARLEWLTATGNSFALADFTDADKLNISTASGAVNGIHMVPAAGPLALIPNASDQIRIGTGSAIATSAVGGMMTVPACSGIPTGAPTGASAGVIPMVVDTADLRAYFYIGGAWHYAALT